ncbi:tetratricopeptide repeat protein [Saccharopolyspora sp. 5N708]|uniref:tetratricopeptide repeat protein n=1 Tax=Saccharopolyspora sp. 5N708 TaxID=3457424 RepID=UPI003FD21913
MSASVERALGSYRTGDVDGARAALRALVDSDASISARRALAGLELSEGNSSDAKATLEGVAASDDQEFGPQAAVALAMLDDPVVAGPVLRGLAEELTGDLDGALASYAGAAIDGDPVGPALADAFLGGLLVRTGRAEEALEPLMVAAESGDPLSVSYACFLAAPVLMGIGGAESAGAALWRAVEADHPAIRAWAALLLSETCAATGDLDRARASFELTAKLVMIDHRQLASRCYQAFFEVLAQQEDFDAVRDHFQRLAADGQIELVPGFVHWMLGEQAVLDHDLATARDMLQRLVKSDDDLGAAATAVRCLIDGEHDGVRTALLRASDADLHRQIAQLCYQAALQLETRSAQQALELLAELGDSDTRSQALFLLGKTHHAAGDRERAVDAWRKGAATDHPVLARSSATGLGVLLTVRGDLAGAAAAFEAGVSYPFVRAVAEDFLKSGDVDGALVAFNVALEGDDPAEAGRAAYEIGRIRADRGEVVAAAEAFRRAADSRDDETAALAHGQLALMSLGMGDLHGAADAVVAAHQHATATGNTELIIDTACRLGDLRRDQGDLAAAREAYEQVVRIGEGPAASWAVLGLGIVAMESGDSASAERSFLRVVDVPHYRTRTTAMMSLGLLAKARRDLPEARRWYQPVIDSGDPADSSLATAHLGELCYWLADRDGARVHYQRVLDQTEQQDLVAEAAFRLGEMAVQDDDLARAAEFLTIAQATDDPDFAPQAARALTDLRTSKGK